MAEEEVVKKKVKGTTQDAAATAKKSAKPEPPFEPDEDEDTDDADDDDRELPESGDTDDEDESSDDSDIDSEEGDEEEDDSVEDEDDEEIAPVPMKKSPKAEAKKAAPSGLMGSHSASGKGADKWAGLLNQLESSGGGPFFFLKPGKTRIRLAPYPGTEDFFTECKTAPSEKYGKSKTKFIILAVVFSTGQGELHERWKDKVVPVVIPKTIMKSILNFLAEEYDLLNPKTGHGLTLVRTGESLNTSYSIMPGMKPQPLKKGLAWPDEDLPTLAQIFNERAVDNDGNAGSDNLEGKQSLGEESDW